jgi:hypothetical protein
MTLKLKRNKSSLDIDKEIIIKSIDLITPMFIDKVDLFTLSELEEKMFKATKKLQLELNKRGVNHEDF